MKYVHIVKHLYETIGVFTEYPHEMEGVDLISIESVAVDTMHIIPADMGYDVAIAVHKLRDRMTGKSNDQTN